MFDFKRIIYTRKNLHVIPEKLPGYNFVFRSTWYIQGRVKVPIIDWNIWYINIEVNVMRCKLSKAQRNWFFNTARAVQISFFSKIQI